MKKDIHPQMKLVTVKCACGAEHRFYTSKDTIRIDVCSNCHPLYKGQTGVGLVIDTEGRIEKFKRRYGGVEY